MKRRPEVGRAIRSTRNVRHASRPQSQATRYQRRPALTSVCGSASRRVVASSRARVGEPHPLVVARRGRQHGQALRVDRRPAGPAQGGGGRSERLDATAQVRRQHLLELHERAHRRLLDAGDGPAGRRPQPDRDGDRLVVVEQQRRHRRAGRQPVAARRPGHRLDRIAQLAQALDVAADRAPRDLQPRRELVARPVAPALQQREQGQQPARRGLAHRAPSILPIADGNCPKPSERILGMNSIHEAGQRSGNQGQGARQVVREDPCARRDRPRSGDGHGAGPARPERRRQDDRRAGPDHPAAAGRGHRRGVRARRRRRRPRAAVADRPRRPVRGGRREPDRAREPRDGRAPLRHAARRRQGARRGAARALRPHRRGRAPRQDLLGRHAPPAGPRGRARRQSARALPRRADHRPRPAQPPRHVGDDRAARGRRHDGPARPPSTSTRPTAWPTGSSSSTTAASSPRARPTSSRPASAASASRSS